VLFKSQVFTQASGSVGGAVYSRNAGGMYMRARANPINPNTAPQQAVRDALRTAVLYWKNSLTDNERENWNTYAFNTPTLNKLGDPTHKSGQQMFIRGNVSRLQAGLGISNDQPTTFDLGSFHTLGAIVADASADTITVNFDTNDDWCGVDGAALLIYMGRPQNATRNFGKGPFQLLTMVLGDSGTPPTSPVTAASLFPLSTGQKVFLQARVTYPDGRLTGKQNPTQIVTA
jgi:hypothetical protein